MDSEVFSSLTSFQDESNNWTSSDILIDCVASPFVESHPYPVDITECIGQHSRHPRNLQSKEIAEVCFFLFRTIFSCSEHFFFVPNFFVLFGTFCFCSELFCIVSNFSSIVFVRNISFLFRTIYNFSEQLFFAFLSFCFCFVDVVP